MIEKKTVINLLEAYSVAVKHYLRGEDGIYYQDLYYLTKFLPAYALPAGIPSNIDLSQIETRQSAATSAPRSPASRKRSDSIRPSSPGAIGSFLHQRSGPASDPHLPMPATSPNKKTSFANSHADVRSTNTEKDMDKIILPQADEVFLYPAHSPPRYHLFDLFPFSLLVRCLTKRGKEIKGKKAARLRAKMKNASVSHNLPLEISLYLVSAHVFARVRGLMLFGRARILQHYKRERRVMCRLLVCYLFACVVYQFTHYLDTLLSSLNMLVDSLTGLERILTTPIPFSYSVHLWVVTLIYCFCLVKFSSSVIGVLTIVFAALPNLVNHEMDNNPCNCYHRTSSLLPPYSLMNPSHSCSSASSSQVKKSKV